MAAADAGFDELFAEEPSGHKRRASQFASLVENFKSLGFDPETARRAAKRQLRIEAMEAMPKASASVSAASVSSEEKWTAAGEIPLLLNSAESGMLQLSAFTLDSAKLAYDFGTKTGNCITVGIGAALDLTQFNRLTFEIMDGTDKDSSVSLSMGLAAEGVIKTRGSALKRVPALMLCSGNGYWYWKGTYRRYQVIVSIGNTITLELENSELNLSIDGIDIGKAPTEGMAVVTTSTKPIHWVLEISGIGTRVRLLECTSTK